MSNKKRGLGESGTDEKNFRKIKNPIHYRQGFKKN